MTGLRLFECLQLLAPAVLGILVCASPRTPATTLLIFLTALFLHLLFTYTYNDYAELDHDADNPRKQSGPLPSRRALGIVSSASFVGCLLLLPALPRQVAVLLLLFQLAGILYSHPRTLWKGRAPLGDLLHVATGAGYFLGGCWIDGLQLDGAVAWGATAFGSIYLSGSLLGQLRDLDADDRAGLRTSARWLGRPRARALALALQALGLLALVPLARGTFAVPVLIAIFLLHSLGVVATLRGHTRFGRFQPRYRATFAVAVCLVATPALPRWIGPDSTFGAMLADASGLAAPRGPDATVPPCTATEIVQRRVDRHSTAATTSRRGS